MQTKLLVALIVSALTIEGCATTSTTTTTWNEGYADGDGSVNGRVQWVRETVRHREGNPAAGAVAGAVVGGLLGGALTGRGIGTLVGAAGGAMIGADQSRGSPDQVSYSVLVRFEDGGMHTFYFQRPPPFRVADLVVWTPDGLEWRSADIDERPPPRS